MLHPTPEFVELPPSAYGVLWYSNVLCGVVRGALEMVQMNVEAKFVKDVLQGDEVSEIRCVLQISRSILLVGDELTLWRLVFAGWS